ncbi:tetratricopeptide repeat protein [bacterium]|nr:tetratricopeptide repeat protein [bacterium]
MIKLTSKYVVYFLLFSYVTLIFSNATAFQKNKYFNSYSQVIDYLFKNSDVGIDSPDALSVEYVDENSNSKYWLLEINCLCSNLWSSALKYNWDEQNFISVKGKLAGIRNSKYSGTEDEVWGTPELSSSEYGKANFIVRSIIENTVEKNFEGDYQDALAKYKKKDLKRAGKYSLGAIKEYYQKFYPIQKANVDRYNDFGFFLEQAGRYKKAIQLLEKVVDKFPERVLAYINLGDAYHGNNDVGKAKQAYQKYIDLMKKEGKEKKIPKRIYDRLK